jgi:hypothetical protein
VLRRLYRLAGIARVRFLRRRALVDILTNPGLAERICDYIRSSGTALEYLNFSSTVMAHPEQVYPDVDLALTEGLLLIEGDKFISRGIRAKAASLLAGKNISSGSHLSRVLAPLLLLRFSDRRSLPLFTTQFRRRKTGTTPAPTASISNCVCELWGIGVPSSPRLCFPLNPQ